MMASLWEYGKRLVDQAFAEALLAAKEQIKAGGCDEGLLKHIYVIDLINPASMRRAGNS